MLLRIAIDAFFDSEDTGASLRALAGEPALAKARVSASPGGVRAAIEACAKSQAPGVVVVEHSGSGAELLALLDELAEVVVEGTKVVAIGREDGVRLFKSVLAKGVGEYLVAPVGAGEIAEALAGLYADAGSAPRGRLVACWGVRGGVGASTLAQNLAWSLSRKGSETIHLDLDLNFGSSALAFDIDGRQTALDALAHPDRLDDVMLDRCLVRRGDRLRVLTSPGDCSSPEPVRLESVSALFDVARAMADVVVVDLPHLWSDWVVFSLASADEVLMAATPDLACLRNAKAAFESLSPKRRGRAEARIVLNRANTSKRSDIVAEDFAEAVGTRPTICIPSEPDVFLEAANEGRMLGETKAGDPAAQLIDRLADEIRGVAAASGASASGSWLSRLFPGKTAKRPRPGRLFAKGAKKEAAP